jgi:hypothetical protein
LLAKTHSTPAATKPERTPGNRAVFDRDGYLIIRGALTLDELARSRRRHQGDRQARDAVFFDRRIWHTRSRKPLIPLHQAPDQQLVLFGGHWRPSLQHG